MIADFSSFIELVAAIYLTISLDDLLLRRFWTPDYAKKLEREFDGIVIPQIAKRPTLQRAKELSSKEDARSRKRGALMFSLTVILLVAIGFEPTLGIKECFQAIAYCTVLIMVVILYTLDELFLRSWWAVIISVGLLLLLFIVFLFWLPCYAFYELWSSGAINRAVFYVKPLMVFVLLSPILWQILRNWIYSRYYLPYIVDLVTQKANEYNKAMTINPKQGHKISEVAKPYLDVIGYAIAANEEDRLIKPFLDILVAELSDIKYVPLLPELVWYSYKTYRKKHPHTHTLARYYKQYYAQQPLPKIESFCNSNGIDYDAFRNYHLKHSK